MIDLLMNLGTWSIVFASLPGMRSAIKNRDTLSGYSLPQAMLMQGASVAFFFAFRLMGNSISMLAQIPPFMFWSIIMVILYRNKHSVRRSTKWRPENAVLWLHVEKKENGFVNHLEKPLHDYTIKLPTWVGLAYRPSIVRVEILENVPPFVERYKDHKEWRPYVKENWSEKLTKMRRLNHNYMQVFTLRDDSKTRQLSVEEYNEYHRKLRELNAKYGV